MSAQRALQQESCLPRRVLPPYNTSENPITTIHEEWARQIKPLAQKMDKLVLLCGDDARLPFMAQLYQELNGLKPLIVAGGTTKFVQSNISEASRWKQGLKEYGITLMLVRTEENSRDTIANAIYTNRMLHASDKKVLVLSGGSHVYRGAVPLQLASGSKREISTASMPIPIGIQMRVTEAIMPRIFRADTENIRSGDAPALEAYLHTRHPFHAPEAGNEPSGYYTRLCTLLEPSYRAQKEEMIARTLVKN